MVPTLFSISEASPISTTCNENPIICEIHSIFNKITPATQVELTKDFVFCTSLLNQKNVKQVAELLVNRAVNEPVYCPIYVKMCRALVNYELADSGGRSPFRNFVLSRAQKFMENFNHKKDRRMGLPILIGHLYRNGALTSRIMHACCLNFMESILNHEKDVDEESVICGIKLLELIGPTFDKSKHGYSAFLDHWFQILEAARQFLPNRTWFLFMSLKDLRKASWISQVEVGNRRVAVRKVINPVATQ